MANVIFHAHTENSHDSLVKMWDVVQRLQKHSIDALFLSEHNRLIEHREKSLAVIASEEINTREGEVIGLYLKREIPRDLSITETINEIHRQGGLVVVPHPFDRLRSKVLPEEVIVNNISHIDIIEVFNARTVFRSDNRKAFLFAQKHNKPMIYGSDAHTLGEYGLTWMEGCDISSPEAFLLSLEHVIPHCRYANLFVHGVTKYVKWKKK